MTERVTYRGHARALLILGLPLVGSHIAQVAIGVTDSVMLGWYDVDALAAVTLGWSMFFIIFIVGSGFAFAVLPMVAAAMAQDDVTQARRVTRMGMWLSAIYGVALMPVMIWSEPLLLLIGQEPRIAALAADYMAIVAWGMVPSLLVMVLKNYLAALERTPAILWITIVTAILNAILNYALIFGNFGLPELGLTGAAIASVLMQLAGLAIMMAYIQRALPSHVLFQRIWRSDPEAFGSVFRLGWPIGLANLAESGLFSASAVMMGWLGALPLAAHGVAVQLASLAFVVHLGVSQAVTVRTGRALGRSDAVGMRDGGLVSNALSVAFSAVTVVLFLAIPELLTGLFVDPADPDRPAIIAIGVTLLAVAALFQLVDGAQVIALGLLRGVQDTRVPMYYAAFSYWVVGIPASYVLGFTLGFEGVGVWLGLVIGLAFAAVLLMARFWTTGLRGVAAKA